MNIVMIIVISLISGFVGGYIGIGLLTLVANRHHLNERKRKLESKEMLNDRE